MAITVDDNNTQGDSYDSASYGGTNIGSGAGGDNAVDSFYQGTDSWGRKIGTANAVRGFHTTITPKGGSVSVSSKANDSFIINANIVIGNRKISDVSNITTIPVAGGNVAVDNEIKSTTDIDKTLRPALQRKIDTLNTTTVIPTIGASVESSKKISKNLV